MSAAMLASQDVFISYGRIDSKPFAKQIKDRLVGLGYAVWFDFEDIPPGVDYQRQIDDGIEKADNFLFIISPHAVNSPYCRLELELALKHCKRIIPLLHVEQITRDTWQARNPKGTDADWEAYRATGQDDYYANMHPAVRQINWICMREGIDDLEIGFQGLLDLLERQKDYVRHHTILLQQALRWQRQQRQTHYLLVGAERQQAEAWLGTQFFDTQPPCQPTDLQCEFITESIKNANNLMTRVFLSYAEEDRGQIDKIRRALMRAGITTWTYQSDIGIGSDFRTAIERGIEAADNVLFLMSTWGLNSEYCQQEITLALQLHKRLIVMQVDAIATSQIPDALKHVQYIDLTDNQTEADYLKDIDDLLRVLQQDAAYHYEHKVLLTKALKWQRQQYHPSVLLRGYELQHALAWLKLAQQFSNHGPTPLQHEFISASQQQPPGISLDVFISYSRVDSDFARKLNDELQRQGKRTWFDQESIASGADFQQEIHRGIEAADHFLFILSPQSVASPYCADEVDYAAQLNKRIITVRYRSIDSADLHPQLAKVQWIDFHKQADDFTASFQELIRTLDIDPEYLRFHTSLLMQAIAWHENGRRESLLLRGVELAVAQRWRQIAEAQAKSPALTDLQKAFVEAGQALSERLQQEAEAQRQRELQQALQLAQAAEAQRQAEAEARHQAEQRAEQAAKAHRISQRITLMTAIGVPLISVLTLATGVAGWSHRVSQQVDKIETLVTTAETHLHDQQPFEALVVATQAGLQLNHMKLFPPTYLRNRIDGVLRWAQQDVQELNRIETDQAVYDVDLSPNQQHLAIANQNGTVEIWDLALPSRQAKIAVTEGEVFQVQFAPDSQSIFTTAEGQPAQQWSLGAELLQSFDLPGETITRLAVSVDGQQIATGSLAGKVYLWSSSGAQLRQFDTGGSPLMDLDISPDGQYLVAGGEDGNAHLWSLTGDTYLPLPHTDSVLSVGFTADGASVVTAGLDYTLRQWDLQGRELKQHLLDDIVLDLDLSSQGEVVALAYNDGRIGTWNLNQLAPVELLMGHQDAVYQVQISADGRQLISSSEDHTVRFWDLSTTQKPTLHIPANAFVRDLHLDSSGGYVLAQDSGGVAKLWSLDGQLISTLAVGSEIRDAKFSPTENLLAIGTAAGEVSLWSFSGQPIRRFTAHDHEALDDDILSVQFSPNGQLIATAAADHTAAVWDLQGNLQQTFKGHRDWVYHVSFSPSGQLLATSSHDETARIWQVKGDLQHQLAGHGQWVLASAFSADGQLLATASEDRTVKIWDVATGTQQGQLDGHEGAVIDIAFVPQQNYLVTTSEDGTARLWDLQGQKLAQYRLPDAKIHRVEVSPDGQYLVSVADNGTLRLWSIGSFDDLLRQSCQQLRPYWAHSRQVSRFDQRSCDRIIQSPAPSQASLP